MKDIDQIISRLKEKFDDIKIDQLKVTHPTDDDGVWFINHPKLEGEIQIESFNGQCPFLIESDMEEISYSADSIDDVISKIKEYMNG